MPDGAVVDHLPSPLTPLPQAGEGNRCFPLPQAEEGNRCFPLPIAGEGIILFFNADVKCF